MPVIEPKETTKDLNTQGSNIYQVKSVVGQTYVVPLNRKNGIVSNALNCRKKQETKKKPSVIPNSIAGKVTAVKNRKSFQKKRKCQVTVAEVTDKKNAYVSIYKIKSCIRR